MLLRSENMGTVFYSQEELAKSMTEHVMQCFPPVNETVAPAQS